MKIKWSTEAKQNYFDTLDYWEEHNASYEYPLKIIRAVELTEIEIAENPYFWLNIIVISTYTKGLS